VHILDLAAEYSTEETIFNRFNLIHVSDRNSAIPRNNFQLIPIPVVAKYLMRKVTNEISPRMLDSAQSRALPQEIIGKLYSLPGGQEK
jgi:hypothetical protein